MNRRPPRSTLFPYPTLSRSQRRGRQQLLRIPDPAGGVLLRLARVTPHDRHHRHARLEAGHAQRQLREQQQRSEEHTSELQSRQYLVCRLLLEKKKKKKILTS